MKNVLIVQNQNNSLRVNESVEVNKHGKRKYILGGTFTEFDVKNRNERIYTADRFLPCLEELQDRMNTLGVVYGEFDHPDVFDTSLSRASHVIKEIGYNQEANIVEGKIQLLNTPHGKDAQTIVDDELPLFVSSRAAGITEADGSVTLKKLFTYDIVADPGFGSAKMSSINESCGFSNNSNFRVYAMEDESKINELFNMNKNDLVTKKQLSEYSQYLVSELSATRKKVNEALKKGDLTPKKMDELLAYYENLNESNAKLVQYLDYLAEQIQFVVNENKELKEQQDKIIEHNDYIAENLEKSIKFSDYLAENLDNSIKYNEYIAENLDKAISFSDYLAENLDKNIEYSEYIAENLDKTIEYSEYIAENLDKNIEYAEYIAEHVDNNISYSEYLAENLEGNIAYAEYIAEHLDDNIAYSDYIAESLDKSINYTKMISEKLNSNGKINEAFGEEEEEGFPMPQDAGFDALPEEEPMDAIDGAEAPAIDVDVEVEVEGGEEGENCHVVCDDEPAGELEAGMEGEVAPEAEEGEMAEPGMEAEVPAEEEEEMMAMESSETELSTQIDKLIEEAKKRKASETNEHHFLKFLNKSQIDSFYNLDRDEQETVISHINEKGNYFTSGDVLKLMKEALSVQEESLEDKLIRLMPENIKPIWEQLEDKAKVSILSQARLYPDLTTEETISHFWSTRKMKKNESVTKQLVEKNNLIDDDKLSDEAITGIMEKFRTL
jgi:hypothetical protein